MLHTPWEIVEFHLAEISGAGLDVTAPTTTRDAMAGIAASALAALLVGLRLHDHDDLGGRLIAGSARGDRVA